MDTIKFIKGKFTPEEAKELLLEFIGRKINYHDLKDFSSQVRCSKPDLASQKRVKELREAREQVLSLTKEATNLNCNLVIESMIHIGLEPKALKEKACTDAENF